MAGSVARVERLAERIRVDPFVVTALQRAGVAPGVQVMVEAVAADGSIAIRGARHRLVVDAHVADDVFVIAGDLAAISDAVVRGALHPATPGSPGCPVDRGHR